LIYVQNIEDAAIGGAHRVLEGRECKPAQSEIEQRMNFQEEVESEREREI
jgi:hypothetical protein